MELNGDQEKTFGRSGRPIHGAIFMANRDTKRECLKRNLFGLPPPQINFVKKIQSGMILFLFEYEERKLYGVFQASSDGAVNIVPSAFKNSGKQFPAQIRFKSFWHCKPLSECDFGDAIKDNYYTSNKFNLGLSKDQVSELLRLFESRRIGTHKSKNPLLREKLLNRSLSPVSRRMGVFEDDECRASASGRSRAKRAIDKPFDLITYCGVLKPVLNSSSIPDTNIIDSDSSMLGSPQGLSFSRRVNHQYGNLQSSLNSDECYINSSGVRIDRKVSRQQFVSYPSSEKQFVAYPSSFPDDSVPSFGNQGAPLRSHSLYEKSILGDYIPLEDDSYTSPSSGPAKDSLEDDSYTSPSSGPAKDSPYVPEYVTPIPVCMRSDIPERVSVFNRLKGRVNIHQADNGLEDYISEDIDIEHEDVRDDYIPEDIDSECGDALLATEVVECDDFIVEEPPVNFKRRNKTGLIQDGMATESNSLPGNSTSKRRKIVRPPFTSEGTHEKAVSANSFPNVQESSCQETIECKEKGTSETLATTNGGEEYEKFSVQTMAHPVHGEGNEQEPSETSVVRNMVNTVCKTDSGSGKGGGEAKEKEPTPVSLVAEVSENKDGSSNENSERPSHSQDFKARVEELVQELKGIQGSSGNEQDDIHNT